MFDINVSNQLINADLLVIVLKWLHNSSMNLQTWRNKTWHVGLYIYVRKTLYLNTSWTYNLACSQRFLCFLQYYRWIDYWLGIAPFHLVKYISI